MTSGCEWRHAPEACARRILGILKKSVVELSPAWGEDGWLSLARWSQASGLCSGCARVCMCVCVGGGQMEKASIERLCLSPYVEEPLNSKVIKSFVPELRSRYVFFEFRDSYVLCIYVMNIMNVLHTGMNMSISRIRIWLWYICGGNNLESNTRKLRTHIYWNNQITYRKLYDRIKHIYDLHWRRKKKSI